MNQSNDTIKERKQIFISYSHADQEFAKRLANALHEAGEDVWWDRWEILAGDSLIDKIFEEGLSRAAAFVVVISSESVRSKWVRQELDVATVRKIDGVTKIIPVVIGDAEIPSALRALLWIDMRQNFERGVQRIINSVRGITEISTRPSRESITSELTESVAGLSNTASAVGLFVLRSANPDSGHVSAFSGHDLSAVLNFDPQMINDAVDELEKAGMVRTWKTLGTTPYRVIAQQPWREVRTWKMSETTPYEFFQLEPTYVLYQEFSQYLKYNPEEDIQITAAAAAAAGQIQSQELASSTGLSPGRLNRAVEYLADYGFVNRSQRVGTHPFTFAHLIATRRIRQFAES
jgi:DNA-binding MarR family transcriptional regulator